MAEQNGPSAKPMWAYVYQISPAQPEGRLRTIKALLEREQSNAQQRSETWVGRLVLERQVTHILVVSDTPDQGGEVNGRLEAELEALRAEFSITAPIPMTDDDPPPPSPERL